MMGTVPLEAGGGEEDVGAGVEVWGVVVVAGVGEDGLEAATPAVSRSVSIELRFERLEVERSERVDLADRVADRRLYSSGGRLSGCVFVSTLRRRNEEDLVGDGEGTEGGARSAEAEGCRGCAGCAGVEEGVLLGRGDDDEAGGEADEVEGVDDEVWVGVETGGGNDERLAEEERGLLGGEVGEVEMGRGL